MSTTAPPQTALRRIHAELRATPDVGEGTFESIVSVYGVEYDIGWYWTEIILAGCFDDSIKAQPAIPINWNHIWSHGPIGDGVPTSEGDNLVVRGQLYLDLGDMVQRVWRGMQAQAVREWSIAFYPESITWTDSNPECDQIEKGDLIEASIVYRGAHPDTETTDMRGRKRHLVTIDGGPEAADQEVARLRTRFHVPERSKEGARARGAIAFKSTETSDADWDGPAQEANLSNDDGAAEYKQAFAWVNPDKDADTKAAYAFIHHFVSSEGKVGDASTKACSNGIGVLNGGRGGTSDADWWGDRQGIYDHLAGHLKDAGETPPELQSEDDATKKDASPEQVGFAAAKTIARLKAVKRRLLKLRADDDEVGDPGELAQALDALVDQIDMALDAGDTKGASDLVTAADSTSDDLLEALGVPDDDDLEADEGDDSGAASTNSKPDDALVARLLDTRSGTEFLGEQLRGASNAPPSPAT